MSFRIGTEPHFVFSESARIPSGKTLDSDPNGVRNYDVMPDGKRLLVVLPLDEVVIEPREIRVMLNWLAHLKAQFE